MISTLSEFEAQLKGKMFQGHTGPRFAGVLYGVLMRLEGNGVSAQVLDDLLSDAGFKTRGHYSRYLAQGFRHCDDLYAFERLVGHTLDIPKEKVKPQFHPNRRKSKGLPLQERMGKNEILLQSPEKKIPRAVDEPVKISDAATPENEADIVLSDIPERRPVERPVERPAERPAEKPADKPVERQPEKPAAAGGFQLKRAKKDSEIVRDTQNKQMNYSAIQEESHDNAAGTSRLEESRRAGVPSGARRKDMGGDTF